MRYRPGLPLALDGLSFPSPRGAVRRRRADRRGKSSWPPLFRLTPLRRRVLVDGVDVSTLRARECRRRCAQIIPKIPCSSAVRQSCLDPFDQRTDEEVREALDLVLPGRAPPLDAEVVTAARPTGRRAATAGHGRASKTASS